MGGCIANSSGSQSVGLVLLKGNESVVCQICNVCFNTKNRRPIVVCTNNHNACLTCLDGFREKDIKNCPFCRYPMNLSNPQQNEGLTRDLDRYEKEQKNYTAGLGVAPKMKTDDDLVKETYELAVKYGYQDVIKKTVSHIKTPVQTVKSIEEGNQKEKSRRDIDTAIELSVFKQLQTLTITNNEFTKIGYFGSLPELKTLNLNNNSIKKINPMNNYYRLNQLSLDRNKISKIQNLGILSNLQILTLSNNSIEKLQNLSQLQKLQTLHLSHNEISKIENLQALISLKYVDLSYNQIKKIEGLSTLQNLETLLLNDNKIEKIQNLEALEQLKTLQLHRNQITLLENIFGMKSLKKLTIFPEWYSSQEFQQKNKGALQALKTTFKVVIG